MTKLSDHSFFEKWAVHVSFWRVCLQARPIFFKIGPSSFPILVTNFSDHSFYEKWAVHANFGLACARARSDHFEILRATLKLVHLNFLFW